MIIELDGKKIMCEVDFHEALVEALGLSEFYGMNLAALEDVLNHDVERPVYLKWKNSEISRRAMGGRIDEIICVLRRVEQEDIEIGYNKRFELEIE